MKRGQRRHGRRKPYTEKGVGRLPCARCGGRATHQWQICADSNLWRPVCTACDIALNQLVLQFMNDPEWEAKIAAYESESGILAVSGTPGAMVWPGNR